MKYKNHTGLFMLGNEQGVERLRSLKPFGVDIFRRPQLAVNGDFLVSWEGHAPWDRCSVLIFDVRGFLETDDGALDLGHTYDGEELRFHRVSLDMEDFEFTDENCMDRYLQHLASAGNLRLLAKDSPEISGLLKEAEEFGCTEHLQRVFAEIGLLEIAD